MCHWDRARGRRLRCRTTDSTKRRLLDRAKLPASHSSPPLLDGPCLSSETFEPLEQRPRLTKAIAAKMSLLLFFLQLVESHCTSRRWVHPLLIHGYRSCRFKRAFTRLHFEQFRIQFT